MATAPITSLCNDTAEAVSLNAEMSLFLKPISKLHISVQLPQMKSTGKAISNWEVSALKKSGSQYINNVAMSVRESTRTLRSP